MSDEVSDWSFFQDIRRVAFELGHPPTTDEYNENGRYSDREAYRKAESWTSALRKAGLDPDQRDMLPQRKTPELRVNPEVDYCDRCGAADELSAVLVASQQMDVCWDCRKVLERRSARGGPHVETYIPRGGADA